MHEHQHAPHDEFSPLDTFRILMEEKPEQAERVLRWAKSMHDAVRTVLRQQQTMVGVDQAIYPLAASLDDDCWSTRYDAALALLQELGKKEISNPES